MKKLSTDTGETKLAKFLSRQLRAIPHKDPSCPGPQTELGKRPNLDLCETTFELRLRMDHDDWGCLERRPRQHMLQEVLQRLFGNREVGNERSRMLESIDY